MAVTEAAPHTGLQRQVRLILGGALAMGLLLGVFAGIADESWAPVVRFTVGSLAYGVAYLLLFSLVLPRVRGMARWRALGAEIGISLVAMAMTSFVVVNFFLLVEYGVWVFSRDASGAFVAQASWTYVLLPILPAAALAVTMFNYGWVPMRVLEDRARRADELAASAQLQALRAQIDPHFLFNSLNSIAQLIGTDPVRAEECVQRLAEIFRYLLASRNRTFVTLADELEIADGYLDIERARFGDQLEVRFEIEDRARTWIVPTLIVQPLVENAVRHGISRKVGGGSVIVEARVQGQDLVLDVRDTGVGMADASPNGESTGVGLRNVRDRLVHLYGSPYAPRISSRVGRGTHVSLRVPRQTPAAAGS